MKIVCRYLGVIAAALLLVSCGGGEGGGSCTITEVAGEPDITANPFFSVDTAAVGDLLDLTVSVDAETGHIAMYMIKIEGNSLVFESPDLRALTPGAQDIVYNLDTTAYAAGEYFPMFLMCTEQALCSSGTEITFTTLLPPGMHYQRNKTMDNGVPVDEWASSCVQIPYLTVN